MASSVNGALRVLVPEATQREQTKIELGRRLRDAKTRAGLNGPAFVAILRANGIQADKSQLSRWENGHVKTPANVLAVAERLAEERGRPVAVAFELLHVDIERLYTLMAGRHEELEARVAAVQTMIEGISQMLGKVIEALEPTSPPDDEEARD